jgi:hypothetical protein
MRASLCEEGGREKVGDEGDSLSEVGGYQL